MWLLEQSHMCVGSRHYGLDFDDGMCSRTLSFLSTLWKSTTDV